MTYILRDHFSGVFYAELAFNPELIPLESFLGSAWREKPEFLFCGLPDWLMIPNIVAAAFPGIDEAVLAQGVEPGKVTSGFQSGAITSIKFMERNFLAFCVGKPIAEANTACDMTVKRQSTSRMWII